VATIVLIETSTTSGTLVNRQYFASFAAGGQVEHSVGEDAPAHVPPPGDGPETTVTYPIDPDQTQRFAAAANDWDAYTLDDEIARSMGFPAKIVHGPCTLAFISRALVSNVCGGDATRLKRLAVRFARPLVLSAGQSLTTRIWSVGSSDGIERYGFEATDKEGVVTAKNGWAEVGR
jgi:acyl dehydratase